MAYQTTMAKLLVSVKSRLMSARDARAGGAPTYPKISRAATFKIGPMGPIGSYPALVVMPDSEQYTKFLSGGWVHVARQVTVYAIVKEGGKEQAKERLVPLIREAREALQTNFFLLNKYGAATAFRLLMGPENVVAVEGPKDSLLWMAEQELTFLSKEQLPDERTHYVDYRETTPEELFAEVQSVFEYGKQNDFRLDNDGAVRPRFEEYHYWQVTPIRRFPALAVIAPTEGTTERFAGIDQIQREFTALIWDRYSTEERHVLNLCDHADAVRRFIHKFYRFRRRVTDTLIGTTVYNRAEIGEAYLIQATVPFTCLCREAVSYSAE